MNSEKERRTLNSENLKQSGATIVFLFQLLSFFLSYNISAEIIMLGTGWILLAPGFAIILLSVPTKENQERPIFKYIRHPLEVGWGVISISMTFIAQSLLSIAMTVIFIIFLVLIISEDKIGLGP